MANEERPDTPDAQTALLGWCERLAAAIMTGRLPDDPRVMTFVGLLLAHTNLVPALATPEAGPGLPAALSAFSLYEAIHRPAFFCFRIDCQHGFKHHEPPELAALPEGAYDAMPQAEYDALDLHCPVPDCPCERFLNIFGAMALYLQDTGLDEPR